MQCLYATESGLGCSSDAAMSYELMYMYLFRLAMHSAFAKETSVECASLMESVTMILMSSATVTD